MAVLALLALLIGGCTVTSTIACTDYQIFGWRFRQMFINAERSTVSGSETTVQCGESEVVFKDKGKKEEEK